MPSRLAAALFVIGAIAITTPGAQPDPAVDCGRLLGADAGPATLRDAAANNLGATAVRASNASRVRRTTQAVIDAWPDAAGRDVERLCAALTIDRVTENGILTGYYRPRVPARLARDDQFRYPLYALPDPPLRGLSRADIDRGALDGKVPVVAWLADPVEAFFIHIQGSALLAVADGDMSVGYAGSNGRPYTSIGTWMVQHGILRQDDVSMASLKAYLRDHPAERDAVLQANERYIYFQRLENPPVGSLGVPLTDGRSVAADPTHYPPGSLLFINPVGARAPAGRLVFVQDRGSAITGPGRLDLFVGTGDEAGRVAGGMRQRVEIYVLRAR